MLWSWRTKEEPTELGYDPDRKVTLTIGELVNALGDALHVVEDAPETEEQEVEPKWKRGDRALVEVEVTGNSGGKLNVVVIGMAGKGRGLTVPPIVLLDAE